MVGKQRGISAKELRPFSVEDPLGQKHGTRTSAAWATPPASTGMAPAGSGTITPEQARKFARYGCFLPMILVWGIGLLAGAGTWLPRLFEQVEPALEALVARLEVALNGSNGQTETATGSDTPRPAPNVSLPGSADAQTAAPPAPAAPTTPTGADPAQTDLARLCARTAACCLTVQGERARSLCENFRQVPVIESCQQAYEAFAQVGRQLGRPCGE
jgi:hypothetical protein